MAQPLTAAQRQLVGSLPQLGMEACRRWTKCTEPVDAEIIRPAGFQVLDFAH